MRYLLWSPTIEIPIAVVVHGQFGTLSISEAATLLGTMFCRFSDPDRVRRREALIAVEEVCRWESKQSFCGTEASGYP